MVAVSPQDSAELKGGLHVACCSVAISCLTLCDPMDCSTLPWTVGFTISGVCSNSCPPNHLILYVAWLKDNGFRPRFNCITHPEGSDQELFSDDIDPYEALACCLWHFQKWLLPHDCSDKESFSPVMSLRIPNFSERKRGDYKYRLPSISHFLNSCICGHKKKT